MTDNEFNQKFEKFLNDKKFSKAEIVGMYVLCNEREHDLKQELSSYRAALASRENELRYKETVIKALDEENKILRESQQNLNTIREIAHKFKAENERLRKMGAPLQFDKQEESCEDCESYIDNPEKCINCEIRIKHEENEEHTNV